MVRGPATGQIRQPVINAHIPAKSSEHLYTLFQYSVRQQKNNIAAEVCSVFVMILLNTNLMNTP